MFFSVRHIPWGTPGGLRRPRGSFQAISGSARAEFSTVLAMPDSTTSMTVIVDTLGEVGGKGDNLAKDGRVGTPARWWFQIFSIFTCIWGRFPILTYIFQMG